MPNNSILSKMKTYSHLLFYHFSRKEKHVVF